MPTEVTVRLCSIYLTKSQFLSYIFNLQRKAILTFLLEGKVESNAYLKEIVEELAEATEGRYTNRKTLYFEVLVSILHLL